MTNENLQLKGIGASSGISIAKAYILKDLEYEISSSKITDLPKAIRQYHKAIADTKKQLEHIYQLALKKFGPEKAEIFQAHIQLAEDPEIQNEVCHAINKQKFNLAYAIEKTYGKYHEIFKNMEDAYFKERASDIIDVKKRVLANSLNLKLPDLLTISESVIIVAHDLTPSETALLDKKFVKGFITDVGGRTSHAAIMARTMEIPAVVGLKNVSKICKNNDVIAMNGNTGQVEINPTNVKEWKQEIVQFLKEKEELKKYVNAETKTIDGHKVLLESNIGNPQETIYTISNGSEGIGLYRSEFLYMSNDHWPTEEEQYEAYKVVLEQLKNQLVVIRTLDIGGDKKLKYFKFPEEMNPFLGYRAIRFCLGRKDIFKTQLRALGRASIHGNLAIMFPMIASLTEFRNAKNFTLEVFEELKKEGHKIANNIQIGMMIEVPSAAVIADQFAKYADFFSIGTNDMIQYTFACDRLSKDVAYLYQPNHPAILKLVHNVIEGGHKYKRWVGMCGEMAGDIVSIPLLLGLGLDAFSMSPTSIPKARWLISHLNYKECQKFALECMQLESFTEVSARCNQFLKSKKLI